MKLVTDGVWTISKTHLRILKTAEECMKSHSAAISFEMLKNRSRIQGSFMEHAVDLCKLKFLTYIDQGYKLSCSGMDCLAINALRSRGLEIMGEKIGIGKESDIYIGVYAGRSVALKFHRLGRTSFRSVRNARGYVKDKVNWLMMSKVSCDREVAYLEMFKDMCVPLVLDHDRHVIVQELLDYQPLYKTRVDNPEHICKLMLEFIRDLWNRGYVHGDFNEFNIMVSDDIKVIDFPQCIKNTDSRALPYLKRDFECVLQYFKKKSNYVPEDSNYEEFLKELSIDAHIDNNNSDNVDSTDELHESVELIGLIDKMVV
ncbi:RIO protein kinase [Ordospora colligata]|uniref:non-specific serine/threonine protein kinase n=1 Tax=Ordospora colligata OC4 TaxID=1354746 RepID=A0A0B2UMP5_9MICR|nr:RIO protein kinase [Ordospora colligata OC4]KHN70322.1 RIO protein kinase [Ordospora colligata OC4]TBU16866.1 RIO protein kinase [Ordospora colligata]TBU16974.1 RIO protein kinase [Ordospora colligata]TBU19415.1 RIO protein kinase [Ordospora colligata]